MLAGLALLVATVYLAKLKKPLWITLLPMVFMLFMTGWAMVLNIKKFAATHNTLLLVIGIMVFVLEIWMIIEALIALERHMRSS